MLYTYDSPHMRVLEVGAPRNRYSRHNPARGQRSGPFHSSSSSSSSHMFVRQRRQCRIYSSRPVSARQRPARGILRDARDVEVRPRRFHPHHVSVRQRPRWVFRGAEAEGVVHDVDGVVQFVRHPQVCLAGLAKRETPPGEGADLPEDFYGQGLHGGGGVGCGAVDVQGFYSRGGGSGGAVAGQGFHGGGGGGGSGGGVVVGWPSLERWVVVAAAGNDIAVVVVIVSAGSSAHPFEKIRIQRRRARSFPDFGVNYYYLLYCCCCCCSRRDGAVVGGVPVVDVLVDGGPDRFWPRPCCCR